MQQIINAESIMLEFAAATGLSDPSHKPRRYLWTDAFAVCNFLELYRQTKGQEKQEDFLELALKLVDQVHQTLGKQREDSGQSGWLSGLDDEQAQQHPTLGGLRIGKKLNEHQVGEPADASLEWEQDGQYFHYLTKWMHALDRVTQVTGRGIYNQWALELAKVAHAAFTYSPSSVAQTGETKRMYWKMSIDLSRPLVDSMGHHDPLDGLLTYQQLQATARQFPEISAGLDLTSEIKEMKAMCAGRNWATEDSLGIGGLLSDAFRLLQLIDTYQLQETVRLETLLKDVAISLQAFVNHNQLNLPAEYRLAFRELGLSIGLHCINRMQYCLKQHTEHFSNADQLKSVLNTLSQYQPLQEIIENFWLEPAHQSVDSWVEHADINQVMLATSLAPDGYLQIKRVSFR